jgi:hypothetical protein
LNRTLRGWANYFSVGTANPAYRALRQLCGCAVASVVALQAQEQTKQGRELSTPAPLRDLRARASDPAWARRAVGEGVRSCPRAGCREIRMSGSMSGMWKRSYGRATKAPPDERGGNRHAPPTATAPHPDSEVRAGIGPWPELGQHEPVSGAASKVALRGMTRRRRRPQQVAVVRSRAAACGLASEEPGHSPSSL